MSACVYSLLITLFLGVDFQSTTGEDTKQIVVLGRLPQELSRTTFVFAPPKRACRSGIVHFVLFRCLRSSCARAPSSLLPARTTRPSPAPPIRNRRAGSKHRRPWPSRGVVPRSMGNRMRRCLTSVKTCWTRRSATGGSCKGSSSAPPARVHAIPSAGKSKVRMELALSAVWNFSFS